MQQKKVKGALSPEQKQSEPITEEDKKQVMQQFENFRELMSSYTFSPEILSLADQTAAESSIKAWGNDGWKEILEDSAEEEINSKKASLDVNHISEYGAKIFSYPKCGLKPLADSNYNQEQYLPPDENIEYLKIGPHSVGEVKQCMKEYLKKLTQ